jgi:hypothetical protein
MKQQIGLYLVELGNNPVNLLLGVFVLVALVIVSAIVIAAIRDLKVQRAWARKSVQHFQRTLPQRWG